MAQRGRKSSASLAVPRAPGPVPAATEADGESEAAIIAQTLRSQPQGHFAESDLPLLCEYAGAIRQSQRARAALEREGDVIDGRINPWVSVLDKARSALWRCSTKLRLGPQARRDGMPTGRVHFGEGGLLNGRH
jgi:phage terminase small subunit